MSHNNKSNSTLKIDSERTVVEVPRGTEMLRLQHVVATMSDGRTAAWHTLRVWYRDRNGELRPGKAGLTIRSGELRQVAEALMSEAARFARRE